ncbi:hypothetical protein D3C81_384720 [compost metagenome]
MAKQTNLNGATDNQLIKELIYRAIKSKAEQMGIEAEEKELREHADSYFEGSEDDFKGLLEDIQSEFEKEDSY